MNEYFKTVLSDRILIYSSILSIVILIGISIYIVFVYSSLPPYIPLYHQMPWGEERLAPKEQIFIPFILTIIFIAANFFVAISVYNKMPLLSRIVNSTSVVVCLLVTIFLFQTTRIVI